MPPRLPCGYSPTWARCGERAKGGICIYTERLLIRRFHPDDWRDLHEYLSQPEVTRFEPYDAFTEKKSKKEAARRAKDPGFWAVCLKDTQCLRESGKLIGNIYLAEQGFDTWEFGYVFNQKYHGMGYASEAARALLDDAFANRNAHRVVAECNPLNAASWRLLERLGFRREGHFLKNIYFKRDASGNPVWCDTYAYGMLKEEWNSRCAHEP
jgi:RimJ/RimL family protein N-acetyltransferase